MRAVGWVVGVAIGMAVGLVGTHAFGQGSLTPPGPPGPTMKTLAQVEPRTAITNVPCTIAQPGSYYLTTNLTGVSGQAGIVIMAGDVTLDLNGFALNGVPGATHGINVAAAVENVEIRNGTVRAWPHVGVNCESGLKCRLLGLRVLGNGTAGAYDGLTAGSGSLIQDCLAAGNTRRGVFALDDADVRGCVASGNGGDGISVRIGCRVSACTSRGNTAYGIWANEGCRVTGCLFARNASHGIAVGSKCAVTDNLCEGNGDGAGIGAGVYAMGNDNRIENNQLTGADCGLDIDGTGNCVAGNIVKGNTDNYDIAQGNQLNLLLCEVPESLDWPCSVKLAGTLTCAQAGTNGITVNADDVTIDLAGHALTGPGSGCGVSQGSLYRNLRVFNGMVVNWRGGYDSAGIRVCGHSAILSGLQVMTNSNGIYVESGAVLSDCVVSHSTENGIMASESTLSGCVALYNNWSGIGANQCTLSDCTAAYNSGYGIGVYHCALSHCTAADNGGDGILVEPGCRVSGCVCLDNGHAGDGAGIHVTGSGNCIEGNAVTSNKRGIDVDAAGNFIARNCTSGNMTNWTVVAGNACLVIQATTGGAITGNSGGVSPGSTDPNANFSY